jgi:hypothetical protein
MNLAGVSSCPDRGQGIIVLIAVVLAAAATQRLGRPVLHLEQDATAGRRGGRRMSIVPDVQGPAPASGMLTAIRTRWAVYGPWAILLILIIGSAVISPAFLSTTNLVNILRQAAPLMIVALGQTLVILVGGMTVSGCGHPNHHGDREASCAGDTDRIAISLVVGVGVVVS